MHFSIIEITNTITVYIFYYISWTLGCIFILNNVECDWKENVGGGNYKSILNWYTEAGLQFVFATVTLNAHFHNIIRIVIHDNTKRVSASLLEFKFATKEITWAAAAHLNHLTR